MLSIPDTFREVLIATGALTFDRDKRLVFAGLTTDESEFFLAQINCPPHKRGDAENLLFLELQRRHTQTSVKLWATLSTSVGHPECE